MENPKDKEKSKLGLDTLHGFLNQLQNPPDHYSVLVWEIFFDILLKEKKGKNNG